MISNPAPSPTQIRTCDGPGLKRLAAAGLAWLEQNYESVNQLNVFPVPDGDTGTNMLLTMRATVAAMNKQTGESASAMAESMAHGALMGARGNSGVILSQILRGLARGIEGETFGGADLATAFRHA